MLSVGSGAKRHAKNKPLDLVLIWTRIDDGSLSGRNGLVKLAARILTVIANSAGCERAFSDFGVVHTKRRNRLTAEKVHKTGVLKMNLRQAHIDAGLTRPRRKRAFGEVDEANSDEAAEAAVPEEDNSDFDNLAHQLIQDAEASDRADDNEEFNNLIPTIHLPPRPQPTSSHSQPSQPRLPSQCITLRLLFDYTSTSSEGIGLDFYWKGGLKNLDHELDTYDLLFEEEDESLVDGGEMEAEGGNVVS